MGMRVIGLQKAVNGFGRLAENIQDAAGDGADAGIDIVYERSQVEVPQDTGALKASGRKVPEQTTGPTRSKAVVYGEPGEGPGIIDYAAAVHEILKAKHKAPTKAKYVEDPLVQSQRATKKATGVAAQAAVKRSFR